MKKALTLAISLMFGTMAVAQDLPQPSPAAFVKQRVGLTDVTLEYSRPSVKGREIFGSLVPFDQLWRTGANKATSITFSTPVTIGEKRLDASTYSIFTIPNEEKWMVILNSETELWGVDGYSEEKDVIRIPVTPTEGEMHESFTISIEDVTPNSANVVISWATTSVSFPIEVATNEQAMANILTAIEEKPDDWRVYRNAANYYNQNGIDPAQALRYIERSLELKDDNWYSHFLHAKILASNGDKRDAKREAEKAREMGHAEAEAAGSTFNYDALIDALINEL